jgi:hypothetical protein
VLGVASGAARLVRGIGEPVRDKVAYLMSIGDNTTDFRIYKTEDGGATTFAVILGGSDYRVRSCVFLLA